MATSGRQWTKEETERFISRLETYPELWDISSDIYKDRYRKALSSAALANEFATDTKEIGRKLHNLRTQLNSELRKAKKRKSGSGTKYVYRSGWQFFNALQFMVPSSRLEDQTTSNLVSENQADDGESQQYSEPHPPPPSAKTKKGVQKDDAILDSALQMLQMKDDDQVFGDFVASSLRNLRSLHSKKSLRLMIQRAVLEVDLSEGEGSDSCLQEEPDLSCVKVEYQDDNDEFKKEELDSVATKILTNARTSMKRKKRFFLMEVFDIKFVGEVEKYPQLYDYTLKEYSQRDATEKAWNQIATKMKMSVRECKEKWRNCRTTFSKNLKQSGCSTTGKRPHYLTQAMQFVIPFMTVAGYPSGNSSSPTPEGSEEDVAQEEEILSTEDLPSPAIATQQDQAIPGPSNGARGPHGYPIRKRKLGRALGDTEQAFSDYFSAKKAKLLVSSREEGVQYFMLSLVPDLVQMNDVQLRKFKKRALELVEEVGERPFVEFVPP